MTGTNISFVKQLRKVVFSIQKCIFNCLNNTRLTMHIYGKLVTQIKTFSVDADVIAIMPIRELIKVVNQSDFTTKVHQSDEPFDHFSNACH